MRAKDKNTEVFSYFKKVKGDFLLDIILFLITKGF